MIRSMEEFTLAFQAARCVSTPLVAIRTADPASTTHFITETLRQGRNIPPLLGWILSVASIRLAGIAAMNWHECWANVRLRPLGRSPPCSWPNNFVRTGCCSTRTRTAFGMTLELCRGFGTCEIRSRRQAECWYYWPHLEPPCRRN